MHLRRFMQLKFRRLRTKIKMRPGNFKPNSLRAPPARLSGFTATVVSPSRYVMRKWRLCLFVWDNVSWIRWVTRHIPVASVSWLQHSRQATHIRHPCSGRYYEAGPWSGVQYCEISGRLGRHVPARTYYTRCSVSVGLMASPFRIHHNDLRHQQPSDARCGIHTLSAWNIP